MAKRSEGMTVEEAGSRGGRTRAQQQEGTRVGEEAKHAGKMTVQEAGKRGGEAVREKFGPEGYSKIGRMGAAERAKRDEMHEFADEAEARVPQEYKDIRQEAFDRTINIAKEIIPEAAHTLLEAGFDPSEARSKIESDFGEIWRPRTITRWLPAELKDAEKALAGVEGGKETGKRSRSMAKPANKDEEEVAASDAAQDLSTSEEEPEIERPTTNRVRINSDDFAHLRRSIERAERLKAPYITLEFNKDFNLTWIDIPENLGKAASA